MIQAASAVATGVAVVRVAEEVLLEAVVAAQEEAAVVGSPAQRVARKSSSYVWDDKRHCHSGRGKLTYTSRNRTVTQASLSRAARKTCSSPRT
jgi:hypothetical protein